MFVNSSDLLSQINAIIQKNSFEDKHWTLDFTLIQNVIDDAKDSSGKNYLPFLKKPQLKKLEERLEKLESQNDQLLCVIYFLFQRISNLTEQVITPGRCRNDNNKKETGVDLAKEGKNSDGAENKDGPALTKREMDVFSLLEKGLCAKEIAKILFISETTVITHKKNLKEKFNARNTVELISKVLARIG